MRPSTSLGYDVFIAEPIPQNVTELVPNGDRRMFSPLSITLIHGEKDAVLVDPPLTIDQVKAVGDWVERSGKNLTHIFATHGHGDHWFTAGILAERFVTSAHIEPGRDLPIVDAQPTRFPEAVPVTDTTGSRGIAESRLASPVRHGLGYGRPRHRRRAAVHLAPAALVLAGLAGRLLLLKAPRLHRGHRVAEPGD